jgi:uncharacterized membrane protein
MKTRFLFPYWCKFLGIGLFLIHIPIVVFKKATTGDIPSGTEVFGQSHAYFMLTTLLMLTGMVLFAFSKERIEDEQIAQLRMDSLQWAVYLSYLLLIIALAIDTNKADLRDIIHMNVWVPLLIFILLFRFKMYRNTRYIKD